MERSKIHGECCEACGSKGFTWDRYTHDGRPKFYCSGCGDEWTSGHDGWPYKMHAQTRLPHRGQQQFLADANRPYDHGELVRGLYSNKAWKRYDRRPHHAYGYGLFS